jgi:hypothetical protein
VLHALDQSKPTKKQMMQIGANLAGVAVGSGAMTGGFSYMHANQAKHLIKQDFSPGAGGVWVDVPQAETKQLIWGKNKFPLIGAGVGLAGSLAASALMAKMTGDAPSQKGHRIGQVAIGVAVSTLFTGSFEGHNAVYQQYQETDGTIAARPYDPYVDINKIFPPLNKDDFKEATVYRLVRTREAGTSTAEQGVGPFDTSRFEEGGWTSVKGKSTTKADGATLPIYRTVDTWDATTNTITTTTATGEKENSSIMQRQKNTLFEQFTPISTFTLEPSEVSDLSSQSRFHGSYTPTFTPTPTTMPVSVTTSHTAGTMGGCKREYLDSMAAQITPPPSLNDLD